MSPPRFDQIVHALSGNPAVAGKLVCGMGQGVGQFLTRKRDLHRLRIRLVVVVAVPVAHATDALVTGR